jgi:hypothetical protein
MNRNYTINKDLYVSVEGKKVHASLLIPKALPCKGMIFAMYFKGVAVKSHCGKKGCQVMTASLCTMCG